MVRLQPGIRWKCGDFGCGSARALAEILPLGVQATLLEVAAEVIRREEGLLCAALQPGGRKGGRVGVGGVATWATGMAKGDRLR